LLSFSLSGGVKLAFSRRTWIIILASVLTFLVASGAFTYWFRTQSIEHKRGEVRRFYQEGVKALEAGDIDLAVRKLEKAKSIVQNLPNTKNLPDVDKKLKEAKLAEALTPPQLLKKGKKDSLKDSPGDKDSSVKQTDSSSSGESGFPSAESLLAFLPDSLKGYQVKSTQLSDHSVLRGFSPLPSKASLVESLVVAVHGHESAESAKQFVEKVDKRAFSKQGKNLAINGKEAYFGTDGKSTATLAWAEGHIAVEVQLLSARLKPVELADEALSIAKQF
jgi:hypothetical protein